MKAAIKPVRLAFALGSDQKFSDATRMFSLNSRGCGDVSSDCIQRKRPDTIINFLKGLAGYAAFFTSGTITVASRYDSNDNGLPVFM